MPRQPARRVAAAAAPSSPADDGSAATTRPPTGPLRKPSEPPRKPPILKTAVLPLPFSLAVTAIAAVAAFYNSLWGAFVFDDLEAVVRNPDVVSPGSAQQAADALMTHDYWGAPLASEASHKSFRPLTTLSFMVDAQLQGGVAAGVDARHSLSPIPFHVVNVLLHAVASVLVVLVIRAYVFGRVGPLHPSSTVAPSARDRPKEASSVMARHLAGRTGRTPAAAAEAPVADADPAVAARRKADRVNDVSVATWSTAAGLLFALHPLHCDAVSGIAGRAEPLCAVFYLSALLVYPLSPVAAAAQPSADGDATRTVTSLHALTIAARACASVVLAALATLAKEQGVTALGVVLVMEAGAFVRTWKRDSILRRGGVRERGSTAVAVAGAWLRSRAMPALIALAGAAAIVAARVQWMGGADALPRFDAVDNPAAADPSIVTRTLTYWWLAALDAGLMLFPTRLVCDWSGETVPLVTSFADLRNVGTLALAMGVMLMVAATLSPQNATRPYRLLAQLAVGGSAVAPKRRPARKRRPVAAAGEGVSEGKGAEGDVVGDDDGDSGNDSGSSSGSDDDEGADADQHVVFCLPDGPTACLALLAVPFLPASNVFFPVGFVVAERVLYLPSVGYCALFAMVFRSMDFDGDEDAEGAALAGDGDGDGDGGAAVAHVGKRVSKKRRSAGVTGKSAAADSKDKKAPPKPPASVSDVLSVLQIAALVLLATMGTRTVRRNREWASEETLYRSGVAAAPDNAKLHHNLGRTLKELGRVEEARDSYAEAVRIREDYPKAWYNLGNAHLELKESAEAERAFRMAAQLSPGHFDFELNYGIALGRRRKFAKAEMRYRAALEGGGVDVDALLELDSGDACASGGGGGGGGGAPGDDDDVDDDDDDAEEEGDDADAVVGLQDPLVPACSMAHVPLLDGFAIAADGDSVVPVSSMSGGAVAAGVARALTRGDMAQACSNLAIAVHSQERPQSAVALLQWAVALDPTHEAAQRNLAMAEAAL